MKGVVICDQFLFLSFGQAVINKRKIKVFIPAIEFVANNRMADVGEVNADLVFATG
jgi:hypothetical protein